MQVYNEMNPQIDNNLHGRTRARAAPLLKVPAYFKTISRKSVAYRSAFFWNGLPVAIVMKHPFHTPKVAHTSKGIIAGAGNRTPASGTER